MWKIFKDYQNYLYYEYSLYFNRICSMPVHFTLNKNPYMTNSFLVSKFVHLNRNLPAQWGYMASSPYFKYGSISNSRAAPWWKRLIARLPPLGSRVRVSITLLGFVVNHFSTLISFTDKESISVRTNIGLYVWNFSYRTIMYLWMCWWVSFFWKPVQMRSRCHCKCHLQSHPNTTRSLRRLSLAALTCLLAG